jgi:hypothetical protein
MAVISSLVPKMFKMLIGTTALLSAIVATCVKLAYDHQRFKHDRELAIQTMELEHLKFQFEKDRLAFERKRLSTRHTALVKSARQRAEHDLLRISKKSTFNQLDASEFVQDLWQEFSSTEEAIGDDNSRH